MKLIEFFKSYTVDLRNINILYVLDSRRYNMIKMITDCTFSAKMEKDEYIRFYLDAIESVGVKNFFEDYVKPIEMLYLYGQIRCKDDMDIKDDFTINAKILYCEMIKALYADYIYMSGNVDYSFKLVLEHMQYFMSSIIMDEKMKTDEDWVIHVNINQEDNLVDKYSDDIFSIFNNIITSHNISMEDYVEYNFSIACDEIIKSIEKYFIHSNIEEDEFIKMYIDSIRYVINNMNFNDMSLTFEDMYDIIIDTFQNDVVTTKEKFRIYQTMKHGENIIDRYDDYMSLNNLIIHNDNLKIKENIKIYYD